MCDQLKKIPLTNISIDHVKMKPKQITAPSQTAEVFSFLEGFHLAFIRNNGRINQIMIFSFRTFCALKQMLAGQFSFKPITFLVNG